MEQKAFKVGQVWRTRSGASARRITRIDLTADYPIRTASGDKYTLRGELVKNDICHDDLVELLRDAPTETPTTEAPNALSATARAAIEAAIIELEGDAAHAASERDAALKRYEEAAARQREKSLAVIELRAVLVRMPETAKEQ